MADIVQRALEAVEETKSLWFAAEKRATELAQDNERLRRIVGCMVRTCANPPHDGESGVPAWSNVTELSGHGSTRSIELCREFDVDPHAKSHCLFPRD